MDIARPGRSEEPVIRQKVSGGGENYLWDKAGEFLGRDDEKVVRPNQRRARAPTISKKKRQGRRTKKKKKLQRLGRPCQFEGAGENTHNKQKKGWEKPHAIFGGKDEKKDLGQTTHFPLRRPPQVRESGRGGTEKRRAGVICALKKFRPASGKEKGKV